MRKDKVVRFSCLIKPGLLLLLPCYFGGSSLAWGVENGELSPTMGTQNYNVDLKSLDITNNKVGTIVNQTWSLRGRYNVTINCDSAIPSNAIYYSATSGMEASTKNNGYFKLNDYFDVKVEVYIAGERNDFITVPFVGVSNRLNGDTCTPPSTLQTNTVSGSRGRITFLVTKPVINGVSLEAHELVQVFGRLGAPVQIPGAALSRIAITSGIITVPDKCTINNGMPIEVEFGDIPDSSSLLNGDNYQKNIPINVRCQGGSFDTGNINISMGIQPAGSGVASFNPDYLGTTGVNNRDDLGIVLKNNSGQVIVPNRFYKIDNFNNNQGRWNLTAAPIAKPGGKIPEGDFDATASIIADFQ